MKVNFFNRTTNTNLNQNIEGIYFYYLYLCAEKIKMNSIITFNIAIYAQIDLFPMKHIICYYYSFSIQNDPEASLKEAEKNIQLHKNIDAVKRVKHKTKEQIVLLHKEQVTERMYKQYLNEYGAWALKSIKVFDWLELMDKEFMELGGHCFYH